MSMYNYSSCSLNLTIKFFQSYYTRIFYFGNVYYNSGRWVWSCTSWFCSGGPSRGGQRPRPGFLIDTRGGLRLRSRRNPVMSLSDHSLLYQLMHDHTPVNAIILAGLEHFQIEGDETAIQLIWCRPVNHA